MAIINNMIMEKLQSGNTPCRQTWNNYGSHAEANEAIYFVKDNGARFNMDYIDKLFGVFFSDFTKLTS